MHASDFLHSQNTVTALRHFSDRNGFLLLFLLPLCCLSSPTSKPVMAAPGFGFSIGDVIVAIACAIKIYKACKDIGGDGAS